MLSKFSDKKDSGANWLLPTSSNSDTGSVLQVDRDCYLSLSQMSGMRLGSPCVKCLSGCGGKYDGVRGLFLLLSWFVCFVLLLSWFVCFVLFRFTLTTTMDNEALKKVN